MRRSRHNVIDYLINGVAATKAQIKIKNKKKTSQKVVKYNIIKM